MEQEELKLSDKLAIERTVRAADRTMLAFVRTSISMITFGFTLFKLLEALHKSGFTKLMRPRTPENIGIFLILGGTVPLFFSMVQYLRTLKQMGGESKIYFNPVFQAATVVFALGLLLLISILLRVAIL